MKFTLGLLVLLLLAWLTHIWFGSVGDGLLALPVIYGFSHWLPNPSIGEIAKTVSFKNSLRGQRNKGPKAKILDFKTYRRGAKQ